ncbi:MAG: ABC transporter permease [Lachnospiraceae bacterium]|nr:ABC transporter permease [Lachnospiraceae bacterium]
MKTLFYPKLAWDGIRKNNRLFFPYMLTCICMISMFYILVFLASPGTVELLPRGKTVEPMVMVLGSVVIAVFSLIFLYYTNSFFFRRRASEFGLYNVLGMDKRNLTKIITMESVITMAISITLGLFLGIAFSKLAELGLVKIVGGTVNYRFRVDAMCVVITIAVFLAIFMLIWLASVIRVGRKSAVSLLKSDKEGEKRPKANWFLGILGAVILGIAYYIAVTIDDPITAIFTFFLAVILVIIATYLLMIAGSVLFCRILQKNKNYYYNPKHFVSVSSMVYRMKRNGAGLASIAIIATMILVVISSASSLWFGTKNMIESRYPADINFIFKFQENKGLDEERLDNLRRTFNDFGNRNGAETETVLDMPYWKAESIEQDNKLWFYSDFSDITEIGNVRETFIIPVSSYNRSTGKNITLNEGEALVFSTLDEEFETVELAAGSFAESYKLMDAGEDKFLFDSYVSSVLPHIIVVVPDFESVTDSLLKAMGEVDGTYFYYGWVYDFDVKDYSLSKFDYAKDVKAAVSEAMENDPEIADKSYLYFDEREYESAEIMSFNGSMFFIGIVLSIVFIFAAVLIIYYKQISEGYEDSKRFEVMRKVGMTAKEIKKNINSQLLVVFFIPLLFAGVHLVFAFPMIGKILNLFGLFDRGLFIVTTLISYLLFAVFYAVVYKVTSNVYYNIVSNTK